MSPWMKVIHICLILPTPLTYQKISRVVLNFIVNWMNTLLWSRNSVNQELSRISRQAAFLPKHSKIVSPAKILSIG